MTHEDLKAWRTRMGWTQKRAADELGLSLVWYQQIERGTRYATGEPALIERRTYLACMALEHLEFEEDGAAN